MPPDEATARIRQDLERLFPRLRSSEYAVTSEATRCYNCIAWASHDDTLRWEPEDGPGYYWPSDAPTNIDRLDTWTQVFRSQGWEDCTGNVEPEENFEKVAIYANQYDTPQHVARQLLSGDWTSKVGNLEDISHVNLEALLSVPSTSRVRHGYGHVACVMKRAVDRSSL